MFKYFVSHKKNIFSILFFIFLSTAILSPIGSSKYLPANELITHTVGVIQAKLAFDQGQFPIRTAPLHQNGWGAAWYQFYSPLSYMMAGFIYKYIVPNNPYLALKILIWFGLFTAAFYFYRLVAWLTHSQGIGLLAGTVYVLSPYLVLNIHARGDFTEAISQMILPLVLYYNLRLFYNNKLYFWILSSIAWFMLLSTCVITYVYFSLFFALLLLLCVIREKHYFKNLILLGISYLYAIILGAYYVIPIGFFEKYFDIDKTLNQFEPFSWLTSLPALFSIKALSPMPLPGNNLLGVGNLYFAIGLPILLGVGIATYSCFNNFNFIKKHNFFFFSLLFVFFIAFFLTWTPFNFWVYFPKVLQVPQFSYRLLTHVMWSGTILFSFALLWLFNYKFDIRNTFICLILIIISSSSWIPNQVSAIQVADLVAHPDLGAAPNSYLYNGIIKNDPNLANIISVKDIEPHCIQMGFKKICHITLTTRNTIQLPMLYYPQLLKIKVNNKFVGYAPTLYHSLAMASITLEAGTYEIIFYFQGLAWANWISMVGWLSLMFFILLLVIRLIWRNNCKRIVQNKSS